MPLSIYPPTLKSSQPAFPADSVKGAGYNIYFTLQHISSINEIGHVQVRIVYWDDNTHSIANLSQFPDGNMYFNGKPSQGTDEHEGEYYVNIPNSYHEGWKAGQLYKIQVRFGKNPMFTSVSNFVKWNSQQVELSAFSEWSNVMVVKAFGTADVYIQNERSIAGVERQKVESSLTPLFIGESDIQGEIVEYYKFDLYSGKVTFTDLEEEISPKPIESSGWVRHITEQDNKIDKYRFSQDLENGELYTVIYYIKTKNGYESSCKDPYVFTAEETYYKSLEGMSIKVEDDSQYCIDNGVINIYVSAEEEVNGNFVLIRTSEKSGYTQWEDIKFFQPQREYWHNQLLFQDFTIESGIRYKYALQQQNSQELRSEPLVESSSLPRSVDFEYSYLYRDGVQLRIQFNQQLSSFKYTTLRSKQDTIGGKYAHLVQNGDAYYAEFPINGLISFHMDTDQTFFKSSKKVGDTVYREGLYYNNELVIPNDKFTIEEGNHDNIDVDGAGTYQEQAVGKRRYTGTSLTIDTNLTKDNVFIERVFREKAEEFLNDFKYKLYRSPTEGNIVVGLMNVQLQPNEQLGRMIFSFSATAYQVLDNDLSSLNECGIVDIGRYQALSTDTTYRSFGQVRGIYGTNVDVYNDYIVPQENVSIGGGFRMDLQSLKSIWIEQYPRIDLTGELLVLEAKKVEAENEGRTEEAAQLQQEHDELFEFYEYLNSHNFDTTTTLSINDHDVIMRPGKIYHLTEPMRSLMLVSAVTPIILNYVSETTQKIDETVGVVSSVDTSRIWGQLFGVFSGIDGELKTYDYNYLQNRLKNNTFRVLNPTPVLDTDGSILPESYRVYSDINLLDVIKDDAQHQVETMYGTVFAADGQGNLVGKIGDTTEIYYEFSNILAFDIEADEGTVLHIARAANGSDAQTVRIGPTGRYTLTDISDKVKYIALDRAQFCVVNYKCLTNQKVMV